MIGVVGLGFLTLYISLALFVVDICLFILKDRALYSYSLVIYELFLAILCSAYSMTFKLQDHRT